MFWPLLFKWRILLFFYRQWLKSLIKNCHIQKSKLFRSKSSLPWLVEITYHCYERLMNTQHHKQHLWQKQSYSFPVDGQRLLCRKVDKHCAKLLIFQNSISPELWLIFLKHLVQIVSEESSLEYRREQEIVCIKSSSIVKTQITTNTCNKKWCLIKIFIINNFNNFQLYNNIELVKT